MDSSLAQYAIVLSTNYQKSATDREIHDNCALGGLPDKPTDCATGEAASDAGELVRPLNSGRQKSFVFHSWHTRGTIDARRRISYTRIVCL